MTLLGYDLRRKLRVNFAGRQFLPIRRKLRHKIPRILKWRRRLIRTLRMPEKRRNSLWAETTPNITKHVAKESKSHTGRKAVS